MSYDRSDLVRAYLAVHASPGSRVGGYEQERDEYNEAVRAYHRGLLAALQAQFEVELDIMRAVGTDAKVLLMLFRSTADSYLAARTPWSRYLEAGLLINRLEAAGEAGERVPAASRWIEELHTESQAQHLEILDALVGRLLGDRAELVVSSETLLAAGFDPASHPRSSDYPDVGE